MVCWPAVLRKLDKSSPYIRHRRCRFWMVQPSHERLAVSTISAEAAPVMSFCSRFSPTNLRQPSRPLQGNRAAPPSPVACGLALILFLWSTQKVGSYLVVCAPRHPPFLRSRDVSLPPVSFPPPPLWDYSSRTTSAIRSASDSRAVDSRGEEWNVNIVAS